MATVLAPERNRGVYTPSPFELMSVGGHVEIKTKSGTIYTVVRANQGFVVISTNEKMAFGRFFSLNELGRPKVGERWSTHSIGSTSPVVSIS